MKKIVARIADGYGLNSLHKEYSKSDQFYLNKQEVSILNGDYNQFYIKPTLPEIYFRKIESKIGYDTGKLNFLSQINNGDSNKNAIFHYSEFKNQYKNISVIFIHGWRASKLNRLENIFLSRFIEKRYNIYSYILPYHMERCPDASIYNGENFFSANINRTLKSVQQSVNDIRALIRYIKEKRSGKIIVIGLSLGGLISNLICEVEEDIDALISLFYANDLVFTSFETIPGQFIRKDLIKNNIDPITLRKYWSVINPSNRKPVIDNNNIFLASGRYDKYVLNQDTDKLWTSWDKPKRIVYDCGHSGIVLLKNKIKYDVLNFIKEREL